MKWTNVREQRELLSSLRGCKVQTIHSKVSLSVLLWKRQPHWASVYPSMKWGDHSQPCLIDITESKAHLRR